MNFEKNKLLKINQTMSRDVVSRQVLKMLGILNRIKKNAES